MSKPLKAISFIEERLKKREHTQEELDSLDSARSRIKKISALGGAFGLLGALYIFRRRTTILKTTLGTIGGLIGYQSFGFWSFFYTLKEFSNDKSSPNINVVIKEFGKEIARARVERRAPRFSQPFETSDGSSNASPNANSDPADTRYQFEFRGDEKFGNSDSVFGSSGSDSGNSDEVLKDPWEGSGSQSSRR
ncbi:hypothetical protein BB560_001167 [Smittium megazygosporum]|uniref:Uncharacterized protein n=1 Tax=Smittium megazygosporum TaxID=133381 RepID=A0A2T9ZA23_9FUNG|nr:hypothetical protein BB560_004144 [Smittium megazygosporum]PVV04336.1 hypothetical protein BB560_001167 [Smittium megazygosporum]